MLFMVIERFKDGDPTRVSERFRRNGRMLPEDIAFHDSWVDTGGTRCFMIMEAPHAELLRPWVNRWADLIDFEIVPIETSREFWTKRLAGQS